MSEQSIALAGLALAGALPAVVLVVLGGRKVWWLLGGLVAAELVAVVFMAISPSRWGVLGWVVVIALSPVLVGALIGAGVAAFWKGGDNDRR